jgi:hypothetical protein
MGYKLISTNGDVQYNVNEYIVDTPEDLEKLPYNCVMGSSALCLSNSSVYIKNSKGKWVEI